MHQPTAFAPQLLIPNGVTDASFYTHAFGAIEEQCLRNNDGSIHVAEFSINGVIFHLHESKPGSDQRNPKDEGGTTVIVGLFIPDAAAVMDHALAAGATLVSEIQDYEYGYRQGKVKDLFGHIWMIQEKIF